jgi:hypothetical protein
MFMMHDLQSRPHRRRGFAAAAYVFTTAALVASLAVAATVVSIGMARAATIGDIASTSNGKLALAIFLTALIVAMGGFAAAIVHAGRRSRRRRP